MMNKIPMLALAGLIAFPSIAGASAGKTPTDLTQRIDELSRQIDGLKTQLAQQNEVITKVGGQVESIDAMSVDNSEAWDLAARIRLFGDFRTRLDMMRAETAEQYSAFDVANAFSMALAAPRSAGGFGFSGPYPVEYVKQAVAGFKQYSPQQRAGFFSMMGYSPDAKKTVTSDTLMTNRFRLNMEVQATEYVKFKARLAAYKTWGMESNPAATFGSPYTLDSFNWDGNSSRQPFNNVIRLDRAYMNWTNIAGQPLWLSIGRRPTTDGPPAHIRLGNDEKMATPISYMNYAFDGATLGYAYNWADDMGSGKVRFCYGRGFEDGLNTTSMNDMDFAGISWDVLKKGSRFFNVQAFKAFNLVNMPDGIDYPNPFELAGIIDGDGILDKENLGNLYHTTAIYMDKIGSLNFFLAGGWSRTNPSGYDEAGNGLLTSWWDTLTERDGYSVYGGVRYDINDIRLKIGAEVNWGSEYWIGMSPAHDDLFNSKLATRGTVGELYMIYDLPTGEALSKYAKTFMRLGYQYYKYDYTYSGSWLGQPVKVDELADDPFNAQFYPAIEDQQQVYLTIEVYF